MGIFDRSNEAPKKGRGRPKKGPFALVPEEYRDETAGLDVESLNLRIAEVAKSSAEVKKAQKEDPHIAEVKEQLVEANAGYKEALAANDAKLRWLMQLIGDKGGE